MEKNLRTKAIEDAISKLQTRIAEIAIKKKREDIQKAERKEYERDPNNKAS